MSIPDLEDLAEEMARGKIYECTLRDPSWRLDGLQHGEAIYIDPRPAILETLVHELLHRMRRRWSERRVRTESRRILSKMSEQEIASWYRKYNAVKRKGRPVDVEDE